MTKKDEPFLDPNFDIEDISSLRKGTDFDMGIEMAAVCTPVGKW